MPSLTRPAGVTRYTFRWLVSAFLAVSTGCVSHEYKLLPRNDGDTPPYALAVGDEVSITTKNDQNLEFEITEISEKSIRGNDVEVSYEDIQAIQIKKFDGVQTGNNAWNVLLGFELLMVIVFTAVFA